MIFNSNSTILTMNNSTFIITNWIISNTIVIKFFKLNLYFIITCYCL